MPNLLIAALIVVVLTIPNVYSQTPHAYTLSGDVAGTHDPSLIKEGLHESGVLHLGDRLGRNDAADENASRGHVM